MVYEGCLPDVIHLPVADQARHALAVAMGIQADVQAIDGETDV